MKKYEQHDIDKTQLYKAKLPQRQHRMSVEDGVLLLYLYIWTVELLLDCLLHPSQVRK